MVGTVLSTDMRGAQPVAEHPSLDKEALPSAANAVRLYVLENEERPWGSYPCACVCSDINVVAVRVHDCADALSADVLFLQPDVLLVPVVATPPEYVETIRARFPNLGIILVVSALAPATLDAIRSMSSSEPHGLACVFEGDITGQDELGEIVRGVHAGRVLLSPPVMQALMDEVLEEPAQVEALSPRENEVLGWLANGFGNRAIAESMGVETNTVEAHIMAIYGKLGGSSDRADRRVDAALTYYERVGLPGSDEPLSMNSGPGTSVEALTPREVEVLELMSRGYQNDAIAKTLKVSPRTVNRHVGSLYDKLGSGQEHLKSRTHAVLRRLRARWPEGTRIVHPARALSECDADRDATRI